VPACRVAVKRRRFAPVLFGPILREHGSIDIMGLHIESPEAGRLAQELAELTGEPIDQAITKALHDRLTKQRELLRMRQVVREISDHFMSLPVLDPRTPDEILGYDENGLPT
jgi:antitoxin VapB